MSEDRTITFPMQAVEDVANWLCDRDWNLPVDEAHALARDLVIDVTLAVDNLRASEAKDADDAR